MSLLCTRVLSNSTTRPAVLQRVVDVVSSGAIPVERYASAIAPLNSSRRTTPLLYSPFQNQQLRFKHAAKKGLHLQKLDEMAHNSERDAAEERRKKKKEKTAARKSKKGASRAEEASASSNAKDSDDWDEELEEEEEEEHDESILPDPAQVKKRMLSHVDGFKEYLKGVRGAEPTPELFDDVMVTDAYGKGTGSTSLKSVAQIVISSPTLAVATCFDPATSKAVSVAIRDKLELNPQVEEGGTIKIPLPRVSMESRQQTAAAVQKRAENYRQRIRKNRRTALDVVKQGVAGKLEHVSKDDAFRVQQEIEIITETVIKELNQIADKKHDDIMAV